MTKVKPNKYPEWAKNLVRDEINKEFNRYEPPQAKKDIGWVRGEVPPRQWVNYQYNLINEWIEYFDSKVTTSASFLANTTELPDPTTLAK